MSLTEYFSQSITWGGCGVGQTGEGKRLNQELVARHAVVSKLWALDRIEDI